MFGYCVTQFGCFGTFDLFSYFTTLFHSKFIPTSFYIYIHVLLLLFYLDDNKGRYSRNFKAFRNIWIFFSFDLFIINTWKIGLGRLPSKIEEQGICQKVQQILRSFVDKVLPKWPKNSIRRQDLSFEQVHWIACLIGFQLRLTWLIRKEKSFFVLKR